MRNISLVLLLVIMIIPGLHAQTEPAGYPIRLKTMTLAPGPGGEEMLASLTKSADKGFHSIFFRIIQFYEIPGQPEKDLLKKAGIELLDYLPDLAYFAAIRGDADMETLPDMRIRCILEVKPDYKLDPALLSGNFPGHALDGAGTIRLNAGYYPNLDPAQIVESFEEYGVNISGRDDFGKIVEIAVPVAELSRIASLPFVMYLEPVSPEPVAENYTGRSLHHGNIIASDYLTGRHYDGTGVKIMLQDDGVVGPHLDYQGRIGAQYLTSNSGNHGDHCAGILMAAGNIDPKARGNAFGADLYVYSVSPNYPGFSAIPTVYSSLGIRVTSASYGDGCNAGYTSLTRTLDQQVRTYPALMHVFSAGNSGTEDCGYGAGPGWGNITGGHKQGKNVIAVANLDYQDGLSSSSSRGPAYDGRIKPDIGAKGSDVYSTVDPNDYEVMSGTSMACPGVAGTLAQLIQAYREIRGGADPMAGLLKAIVLNTAEDLGNPGPDFKYGWGRINALRAVQVIEQGRFDSGLIAQGATGTHTINVPAGTAQLRVMVYWTDYQAASMAAVALVNNLNITLTDPSSVTWMPWVLSHFQHPDSLNKPAVRGIDNLNNMEQVTLLSPAAGSYLLTVQGFSVPQGPQTYYVVYEFIPETVILTYPAGGESLVPGEGEIIRWDAFGATEPFSLEFSKDNGLTWESVVQNLSGSSRIYNWTVPPCVTGQGLIRVTRGASSDLCAAPFSVMGVPCSLTIDRACENAVHLSWNPIPGAISYEIFKPGEKYMEPIGTTTEPSFIAAIAGSATDTWFSVRALGANGATSRRAIAIEKIPGTFNCYSTDAMMAAIHTAEWGRFQTCMALEEVSVRVSVKNAGFQPLVNPTLHYQLDNGQVFDETWSGTLAPDSTLDFSFTEKIDLSAAGSYLLKAWVKSASDLNPSNDSLMIPLEVEEGSAVSIGHLQNFESWTKCATAPICELYTCPLESGWLNLVNGVHDQHDWRTYSYNTPTSGTGPQYDHTTGTPAGKYLYIEPSSFCVNKLASMVTPCIDLAGGVNPTLTLWYHAWGAHIGFFHIDLFDGSDVMMDVIKPVEGSQGDEWKKLTVDLTPWAGKVVGLRFRGISGCLDKGDFAIDDVGIAEVITALDEPRTGKDEQLVIYPNPAESRITVSMENPDGTTFSIRITDLFSRIVFSGDYRVQNKMVRETIDISGFVGGLYLLELQSENGTYRKKLIIR